MSWGLVFYLGLRAVEVVAFLAALVLALAGQFDEATFAMAASIAAKLDSKDFER